MLLDIVLLVQKQYPSAHGDVRNCAVYQKNRSVLYNNLLLQNTLWKYLDDIDAQVLVRLQSEMEYLLWFWNVDEKLKAMDQVASVQKINLARSVVEEITNEELIYI